MNARDSYWALLHECKFKELYLDAYSHRAQIIEWCITGFLMLSTAASIAALSFWSKVPWLWSGVILLSQILQIVQPLLPFSKRIDAAKYLIPELRMLSIQVETAWLRADAEEQATDYISLFEKYRTEMISLESKFLGIDVIPDKKGIRAKVEKDAENHLRLFFGVSEEQGDECNATEAEPANSWRNALTDTMANSATNSASDKSTKRLGSRSEETNQTTA